MVLRKPVVENANPVAVSVFNFENNTVRTVVDDNGEIWFCAKDVCDVLGFVNGRDAVENHCKLYSHVEKFYIGVGKNYIPTNGGNQYVTFINVTKLSMITAKKRVYLKDMPLRMVETSWLQRTRKHKTISANRRVQNWRA